MAKGQEKVNEDKLQILIRNWNEKGVSQLAEMLNAGESTVNYWAGKLRKSMKSNGMTDEQIKKILPAKRKAQGNVYDDVVKQMLSPERAPKKRGRKPKAVEGPME
ncbi:MAG: hypothetical protein ABSC19_11390 [Syntrophorhabdales bacterium]|jgi:hypothetical protein